MEDLHIDELPDNVGNHRRKYDRPRVCKDVLKGVVGHRREAGRRDTQVDENDHICDDQSDHAEDRRKANALPSIVLVEHIGNDERQRKGYDPKRHREYVDSEKAEWNLEELAAGQLGHEKKRDEKTDKNHEQSLSSMHGYWLVSVVSLRTAASSSRIIRSTTSAALMTSRTSPELCPASSSPSATSPSKMPRRSRFAPRSSRSSSGVAPS